MGLGWGWGLGWAGAGGLARGWGLHSFRRPVFLYAGLCSRVWGCARPNRVDPLQKLKRNTLRDTCYFIQSGSYPVENTVF